MTAAWSAAWDSEEGRRLRRVLCVVLAVLAVFSIPGPAAMQQRVVVSSPGQLVALFDRLGYTGAAWRAGLSEIPRVYLMKVGGGWRTASRKLAAAKKKDIFFRTLGPLVLRANELILADRDRLLKIAAHGAQNMRDALWVQGLAGSYEVPISAPDDTAALAALIRRVDAVPPSLALAQAAEESGWGTSRFAAEGNALFGQWTSGDEGLVPHDQRERFDGYQIAAFDSPFASVRAYMRNINTHPAYRDFRLRRATIRAGAERLSGWDLADTLTRYSERGAAYVETLRTIMRRNRLMAVDSATLADGPIWHVYPVVP